MLEAIQVFPLIGVSLITGLLTWQNVDGQNLTLPRIGWT